MREVVGLILFNSNESYPTTIEIRVKMPFLRNSPQNNFFPLYFSLRLVEINLARLCVILNLNLDISIHFYL